MRVMTIASGSSGNCVYVGDDETHILIDSGVSKKKISDGLNNLGLTISDLDGILITHEHTDHIQGLGVLQRCSVVPIYATYGTINGIKNTNLGKMPEDIYRCVEPGNVFGIKSLNILPVRTSHDALEPCAFRITDGRADFGLLTDLGTYDENIVDSFAGVDCLLLEANHDIRMLETGPYPYYLKQRILSDHGHLCNEIAGRLLCRLLNDNLSTVMLGHLSKENNYPDLALEAVKAEIMMSQKTYSVDDIRLSVAPRETNGQIIEL